MRTLVLVALAACGPDVDGHTHDAAVHEFFDAPGTNPTQCTAAAGTSMVSLDVAGTITHFDRLDAGGIINSGPLAVVGPSMFANLLVTNTDPISAQEAGCCMYKDQSCCHSDGMVFETQVLDYGQELGDHIVMASRFDASFSLTGTLTITHFEHPFDHAPGRIVGSISVISDVRTISGSFDNTFCAAILGATI